jgi:hypothetical protein
MSKLSGFLGIIGLGLLISGIGSRGDNGIEEQDRDPWLGSLEEDPFDFDTPGGGSPGGSGSGDLLATGDPPGVYTYYTSAALDPENGTADILAAPSPITNPGFAVLVEPAPIVPMPSPITNPGFAVLVEPAPIVPMPSPITSPGFAVVEPAPIVPMPSPITSGGAVVASPDDGNGEAPDPVYVPPMPGPMR